MTEQVPHELFNFDAMPLTNEQKILETLLRIEALLAPKATAQPELSMSQFLSKEELEAAKGLKPGGILKVKGRK